MISFRNDNYGSNLISMRLELIDYDYSCRQSSSFVRGNF